MQQPQGLFRRLARLRPEGVVVGHGAVLHGRRVGRDTLVGIGDDSVGHSVTLTITAQGQPQTLYNDVVIVRSGRAVVTFNVQSADAELPTLPAIVRQVVNRVAPLAT